MTVGQLKKILKNIPDNIPVYIADHDHAKYETNSVAHDAELLDQKEADEYEKKYLKMNPEFIIKGKYFVIKA